MAHGPRCTSCNWRSHPLSDHDDLCREGRHPLSIVGVYLYPGRSPLCRGCQRERTARWAAANVERHRRYRTRWERQRRAKLAKQREREAQALQRIERQRQVMGEWIARTFGYDPDDIRRMSELMGTVPTAERDRPRSSPATRPPAGPIDDATDATS